MKLHLRKSDDQTGFHQKTDPLMKLSHVGQRRCVSGVAFLSGGVEEVIIGYAEA